MLIGKLFGAFANVVGWHIAFELNRSNGWHALQYRAAHPVHAIHQPSFIAQNNWVRQIALLNQSDVVCYIARC